MVAWHADQSVPDLARRKALSRTASDNARTIDGKHTISRLAALEYGEVLISFGLERPIHVG